MQFDDLMGLATGSVKRQADETATQVATDRSAKQPKGGKGKEAGQAATKGRSRGGGAAASSGGSSSSSGQDATLLALVSKLALGNCRDISAIKNILYATLLVDRDNQYIKLVLDGAKEKTEAYYQSVKELTPEEKKESGSPHAMAWLGLVAGLAQGLQLAQKQEHKAGKEAWVKKAMEDLTEHMQDLKQKAELVMQLSATAKEEEGYDTKFGYAMRGIVAQQVKVSRVSKTWNPKQARVELHCASGTTSELVQKALISYMVNLGAASLKTTQAPKGDLERRIEALLNAR
eukprot:TRINITY_DN47356_c0_g1_i1.p2 TRINITY_DN47356_c0_g1~~TRINITY_DN47356_c0_g1_i1.p2  ORF type:complete len:289 (+),score=95.51 TRINITY_DN47356_c0_g1_i1:84-950(+)